MFVRTARTIAIFILIGIGLPALISFGVGKTISGSHGVLVTLGGQTTTYDSFEDAIRACSGIGSDKSLEIHAFLSVPDRGKFFLFLRGLPREVLLDGYRAPELSFLPGQNKNLTLGPGMRLSREPLAPGVHFIRVRIPDFSSQALFELKWSRDYEDPESIPPLHVFTSNPDSRAIFATSAGHALAILARLNCVLLALVPAFYLLYRISRDSVRKAGLLFWVFLALTLFLRFYGMTYQAEEGIHPDERAVENIASQFRTGDLKPPQYHYSPGFHYLTAGTENLMAWVVGSEPPAHLGGRFLSALFSWLSCLMVFVIGCELFSPTLALIAAALFGFAFMPVSLSHFGIIEPTMVFFFLVAFRLLLRLDPDSRSKHFFIAGIGAGLAVGVKQTGAVILIPFLAMYLYLYRGKFYRWFAIRKALAWTAGAIVAYLVCAPYTILDFHNYVDDQIFQYRYLAGQTSAKLFFEGGSSGVVRTLTDMQDGLGYPILITAVLGWLLMYRKYPKAFVVTVPFTILFFFIAASVKAAPYHYPLVLCPFLALQSASVVQFVSARYQKGVVIVAATVLLMLPSILRIGKLEEILSGKDTRQQASEWSYQNLPAGSEIDIDFFGPRLDVPVFERRIVPLFARGSWQKYAKRLPRFYVSDEITADSSPEEQEWYEDLRQNAHVIHQFSGPSQGLYNPRIVIYEFGAPPNQASGVPPGKGSTR